MIEDLRCDWGRMAGMIIGESSLFDEVMESTTALEKELKR